MVFVKKALPVIFPTSPPPPSLVPLSSVIVLPNRSLDSFPRNASANPSCSLNMFDPWSARRMPIARSAVSSPNDGHVRISPLLASSSLLSLSSSSSSLLLLVPPLVVVVVVFVRHPSGIPRERTAPPGRARMVPTRSTWGDNRSPGRHSAGLSCASPVSPYCHCLLHHHCSCHFLCATMWPVGAPNRLWVATGTCSCH